MRSWLIFASGVCAGALGVSVWVHAGRPPWVEPEPGVETRPGEMGDGNARAADRPAEDRETEAAERVAHLHAWMERRGTMTLEEMRRAVWEWAKRDPQVAAERILSASRFPNRREALVVALMEWAKLDESSAFAWLSDPRLASDRARLVAGVCEWLGEERPRLVLRWAATLEPDEQTFSLGSVFGAIARTEPEEALRLAMTKEGWQRDTAEAAVWEAWVETDLDGAVRWMRANPERLTEASPRSLLAACAKVRPELCVELLQAHPVLRENDAAQDCVVLLLEHSPQHGEAALALFGKDRATDVLKNWIWRGLEASPERAMSLVNQWIQPAARAELLREGVRGWLMSDERGAREWADTLVDPASRRAAQAAIWEDVAERDPLRALDAMAELAAQSVDVSSGVGSALWKWSTRDPSAAARWVAANTRWVPGPAVSDVAGALLMKDDAEAASWLAELPAGAVRDHAIATAAFHWAEQGELEFVNQVMDSIRDESQRARAQFGIYGSLRSQNRAQAEAWLATVKVSDDVKQQWRLLSDY